MKDLNKIFSNGVHFDHDNFCHSFFSVNDLVEEAIANINDSEELGPGYAEKHPELLSGVVLALIIDHHVRHLIQTMKEGFSAVVTEIRKRGEA